MASESASKPENSGQSNSTPKKRPAKKGAPRLTVTDGNTMPPRHIRRQQERAQMKGNPLVSESEEAQVPATQEPQIPPQLGQAGAELAKIVSQFLSRKPQYTSIIKSLEQIDIEPNIMPVMVGDDTVECLVIPLQDLVFKEWQIMGGSNYEITKKQV